MDENASSWQGMIPHASTVTANMKTMIFNLAKLT